MAIKRFTLVMGLVFIALALSGLIPGLSTQPRANDPFLNVPWGYGRALGLFPVNVLHSLVHLVFGVWGVLAANDALSSRGYCRASAVIFFVLTVFGLIPGLSTFFGLVPLFGHDVWLHAAITAATGYFGYVWSEQGRPRTI